MFGNLLVFFEQVKDAVECTRSDTRQRPIATTNDGECFAWTCLSIGEYAHVVAVHSGLDEVLKDVQKMNVGERLQQSLDIIK